MGKEIKLEDDDILENENENLNQQSNEELNTKFHKATGLTFDLEKYILDMQYKGVPDDVIAAKVLWWMPDGAMLDNPNSRQRQLMHELLTDKTLTDIGIKESDKYPIDIVTYTIYYESEQSGATLPEDKVVTADPDTGEYALTKDDLSDPTLDGYDFTGWYDDKDEVKIGDIIKSDITLTAHWTAQTKTYSFGDIILYNTTSETIVVCDIETYFDEGYDKDNTWVPQALCVIASNMIDDNKARFISLDGVAANGQHYSSYDSLQSDVHTLRWSRTSSGGSLYEDTSLTNRTNIKPYINVDTQEVVSAEGSNWGWLPIDRTDGEFNPGTSCIANNNLRYSNAAKGKDPNTCFYTLYLSDWTLNTSFFAQNQESNSVLMDVDGKTNTATIVTYQTETNLYPAAYACYMYSTDYIAEHEWYLPSMTELMLCMTRFATINNILSQLGTLQLHTNSSYWSSTEYSSDNAYIFSTNSGNVGFSIKNNDYLVRAFCKF